MDTDRFEVGQPAEDTSLDDSNRRAFKQPRRRRRRREMPSGPSFNLWELCDGFGYGLTRALSAIGFGMVPTVAGRFGDGAPALVALALGSIMLLIVVALIRMGRTTEWRLVADALTLTVLTPILITASGIEVADARLGGRSTNFLAAAVATVLIYAIVVIVATRAGSDRTAAAQLGALPGALSITAVLIGTSHFSAGALWRGLALSWMVAAAVTLIAALVTLRARIAVAPAAFALFALGIVFLESTSGEVRSLSSGSSGIAIGATAAIAVILVFIPLPQRRSRRRRNMAEWAPPTSGSPYDT